MSNYVGYLLLGLGNGAVYAALALALVVTYRSSGVINFATGSIALYTAYVYGYLRSGQLLVLIPGLPNTVDLGFTPGFFVAAALALLGASLFGLLLYLLVFRPLRTAPPVGRLVASIGVQLVIVLLIVKRLGTRPVLVAKVFPATKFRMGDTVIRSDRFWFALTIVALAFLLGALFKYTRFGLATRASAETEKGAVVSRISPTRVAALNWMLSCAVAGFAGILIAPLVSLVPIAYSLFIVPALAAAVLSRFERLAPAVIGGFVIGMLQSEAEYLKVKFGWFPSSGGPEMVPLLMIIVVLVVRGQPLPTRGSLIQRTLGRAPRPRDLVRPTIVGLVAASGLMLLLHNEWRSALILSFILGTISLSFVVVTGYAGQISLAQLTLAGTAAYSLSKLTTDWGVPFPLAPLIASTVAMIIGVGVGLPALRVRGLSVAVVTLALAVALDAVWFRNTDIVGTAGSVSIEPPTLFGIDLGWGSGRNANHLRFGFLALTVLAMVAFGVAFLRRSRLGSAMVAVRANERSAAAAGVDVVRVKLLAFAIASFIAGVGGSMLAYRYGTVTYDQFTPLVGFGLFATAYLAGITSVAGGIAAGVIGLAGIVYLATNRWFSLGPWYQLITGALLVFTIINNPEGIMGPNHAIADRIAARRRARRPVLAPAVEAKEMAEAVTEAAASSVIDTDIATTPPVDRAPILSLKNLRVAYGGVVAIDDVSFDVPTGAIVGLIGPNGAGKTTLVDAVSGFADCGGEIVFDSQTLNELKPHQRVKIGLSRTFQAIELYDDLSVEENLEVGLSSGRQGFGHASKHSLDLTFKILGLMDLRERPAGELSQGQRQLVSIGRALVAQPQLLLLDEPAAGLDSTESQWLGDRLRDVRRTGVTILMVDHDVNLVLSLCDYIHVLDFGRLVASGTPAEIRVNPKVIAAYLGATHSAATR